MRIEEHTYQLNIKVLGKDDSTARVQVEELDPMTREEFWEFLLRASKAEELPKSTRPSRAVWRDTKESPQPKSKLKEMDEFNKMYKKFKRKFPQASNKLLEEKTRKYLEQRKQILEEFQLAMSEQLEGKDTGLWSGIATSNKPSSPLPKESLKTLEELKQTDEKLRALLAPRTSNQQKGDNNVA